MVPRIIGFFLIPLYTQYLNPSDYGIVELCGSLGLVTMTLMRYGVPGSVTRFYFDHKDNPEKLQDYVTTVHRFLIFASIVTGIIIGIIFYFFDSKITPGLVFFPFILIVIINSAFTSNSDLQRRLLQSQEKSRYSLLLTVFNASIGISATLIFVVGFKLGALGILYSQLLTTFVFFIQAQLYLRRFTKGRYNPTMLKSSLIYGLNTLPHLLFVLVTPLISKIILVQTSNIASLGIFSLATRFVQPLQLIYSAFNQAYTPIYFALRGEGASKERIHNYSRLIWMVSAILFLGTLFIIPPLIPILTPPRFHQCSTLVPILASGFLWQVIYTITAIDLFYIKKNKFVPFITLGGLIANILMTIVLVSSLGNEALAWAQVFGSVVIAFLTKYFVDKHGEIKIIKNLIWQTFTLCIITIAIDRFFLTTDMFLMRVIAFLFITSLLTYIFVIRNKGVLDLVKKLKLGRN